VLKASVEDRRIDFRLVEDRGPFVPDAAPPRGQPAKRKKQKY
jgi:ribonuclease R